MKKGCNWTKNVCIWTKYSDIWRKLVKNCCNWTRNGYGWMKNGCDWTKNCCIWKKLQYIDNWKELKSLIIKWKWHSLIRVVWGYSQGYYLDEWIVCAFNQVKFDTYVSDTYSGRLKLIAKHTINFKRPHLQNNQILDFKECHWHDCHQSALMQVISKTGDPIWFQHGNGKHTHHHVQPVQT